jgi:hypothetical protein
MDYALQAAPDHPYVKDFPQWFKWRPDGTVQYAENPPKKYQDILPIYFESSDWKNLWKELLDVALFWVEECNIRVFRVDNPHTKPFYFWGWLIGEIKKKHPDVLFLAEAFTRPKIMNELAKQGFSQSYTYFTWRNSKKELTEYVEELTQSLMPLVAENGMDWMYANCSTTAQRGALDWKKKFKAATLPVFQELYKSVASGQEAKRTIETCSKPDYREKLAEELKELRESELWQAGAAVRKLRPEKATVEASMIN